MPEPGVCAAPDYGVVALAPRPTGGETKVRHCRQLKLHYPGASTAHRFGHGQSRQTAGGTQEVQFTLAFDQSQAVKQGRKIGDGEHREPFLEPLHKARLACRRAFPRVRGCRGGSPEELVAHGPSLLGRAERRITAEPAPLQHEPLQVERERFDPLDGLDTGEPPGFLRFISAKPPALASFYPSVTMR